MVSAIAAVLENALDIWRPFAGIDGDGNRLNKDRAGKSSAI